MKKKCFTVLHVANAASVAVKDLRFKDLWLKDLSSEDKEKDL